jgi:predicted acetyltransferase
MDALAEFLNAEFNDRRTRYEQSAAEISEHGFDGYVRIECSRALGENLPDGFVPETTRWLIDDGVYIGRVSIRHELNDHLLKEGGTRRLRCASE